MNWDSLTQAAYLTRDVWVGVGEIIESDILKLLKKKYKENIERKKKIINIHPSHKQSLTLPPD